jgi:hypothetical protein
MSKLIIFLFLFSSTNFYANSELYESDLYYLDKNEVLFYKILNWWSIVPNNNDTSLCFKNIEVRSNKTLNLKYNEKLKILKIYLKEDFADLISIFENKNTYLKNEYVNKKYFKNLKIESIKKVNNISLKDIGLSEYKKINSIKNNLAFKLEGKIAGLLAFNGKISFHKKGDFLRSCPEKRNEKFDIFFEILNIKTDEILVKYSLKN